MPPRQAPAGSQQGPVAPKPKKPKLSLSPEEELKKLASTKARGEKMAKKAEAEAARLNLKLQGYSLANGNPIRLPYTGGSKGFSTSGGRKIRAEDGGDEKEDLAEEDDLDDCEQEDDEETEDDERSPARIAPRHVPSSSSSSSIPSSSSSSSSFPGSSSSSAIERASSFYLSFSSIIHSLSMFRTWIMN